MPQQYISVGLLVFFAILTLIAAISEREGTAIFFGVCTTLLMMIYGKQ